MPLSAAKIEDDTLASGCSVSRLMSFTSFYLLRMLRRYRKIKEDMPLLSGEDRRRYFGKRVFCIKTNVFYLPLPPSTSIYLPFISFYLNLPLSTRQAELAKLK